jgi:hypothetical protein
MPDEDLIAPPAVTASLTRLQAEALTCLYQHRLLSSGQLGRLLTPHTVNTAHLRRQLRRLDDLGLVGHVNAPTRAHNKLYFATATGAACVEAAGEVPARSYRMSAEIARGLLQQHTLAVNETGLCFVEAARALGHECGPLDWAPERAHRMRDGGGRRVDHEYLIADAVLNYVVRPGDGRRIQTCMFLELDRCTMTVARLAAKLTGYARYYEYVPGAGAPGGETRQGGLPAWRYSYPRFPAILIVLTGAGPAAISARIADLRALAAEDPRLRRLAGELKIGATALEQLRVHGPFEPIFTPILGADTTPTDMSLRVRRTA